MPSSPSARGRMHSAPALPAKRTRRHIQHYRIDMGKPTILIVEDEAIIAASECQLFRARGYDAIVALNGDDAIAAARTHAGTIDVILMDVNLGRGIDGAAAAREILRGHYVPVIFVSSLSAEEIAARTEGIPCCGSVPKTAGDEALLAAVHAACAHRGEGAAVHARASGLSRKDF